MSATIDRILSRAVDGGRLSRADGEALMACHDLHKLGRAAHAVTMRLHPEPYRTYNIDRNVNYTNVCVAESCTRRSRKPSYWAAIKS